MADQSWDATASFSWYLYQADVALLRTLEKIVEILGNMDESWKWSGDVDELGNWSLEVEWEEDFTLICKDGDKIVWKELYQVKEYEDWDRLQYMDWVIKLFQCTLSTNNLWINCKTFICSKKQILNSSWSSISIEDIIAQLISSKDKSIWFQKCKSWIQVTWFQSDQTKEQIMDFYKEKRIEINTIFGKKINDGDFSKSFNFWKEAGFWDYIMIHKEIIRLFDIIRWDKKVNWEYLLRYLESKIKRFIQNRKNNKITDLMTLNDIFEIVIKKWENIIDEIVKWDFYQDIFINKFIEKFKKQLNEIKNTGRTKNIKDDLGRDYENFLESFQLSISENIFKNNEKLLLLIRHTSIKESVAYFNKEAWILNFNSLIDDIGNFINPDSLSNKIALLLNLFYFKEKGLSFEKNKYFWEKNEKEVGFSMNQKRAILTWSGNLLWDSTKQDDIIRILNSHLEYLYEKDFIWITDSSWLLESFLWLSDWASEKKFRKENLLLDEKIKLQKYDIVKIRKIRIFCCWCKESNKDQLLSDECWLSSSCNYRK